MRVNVVYRTMEREGGRVRPPWYSRESCAASLARAFDAYSGAISLHVINDGPGRSSAIEVLGDRVEDLVLLDAAGGCASYRAAYTYATERFGQGDLVYFVEDDYLHTTDALQVLAEGAAALPPSIGYLTLYEHPNAYRSGAAGPTFTYLVGGTVWRTIPSTCMTYAARVGTLRRDRRHHLEFTKVSVEDFRMFLSIQGDPAARLGLRLERHLSGRLGEYLFVQSRERAFRHLSRPGGARLATTCPGHACHAELNAGLPRGRDWAALAASV